MRIDVSMPLRKGAVFRLGTPPVDVATRRFRHAAEGDYETTMLSLPAHAATHVDLVRRDLSFGPDRMFGAGKLIDVSGKDDGAVVSLAEVERQATPAPGDFVFFRTDWSRFAGSDRYYRHPELSEDVVRWLIAGKVNAVGIDALGLGRDGNHGRFDRWLVDNGIFIVENLVHLDAIPPGPFRVCCMPLNVENVDALPARVVVETP